MVDHKNENPVDSLESNSLSMTRQKICFVGNVNVGKTALITRFIENSFKEAYEPSIGVDFCSKYIQYKSRKIKLQIWDSAGQERYKCLIPTYIRGASIVFIVYDINNRDSFDSVQGWISFVKNIENTVIILCGNKLDLSRKVEISEGEKLAGKEDLHFFEVSAKTNQNVRNLFFSAFAELPVFDEFTGNKLKLISELMQENTDMTQDNINSPAIPNEISSKEISVKDKAQKEDHKFHCKC